MKYAEYRNAGYPIGSANAEAACKHIVGKRLMEGPVRCKSCTTMIRINGCSIYEGPAFFDAVIRKLRHHPGIAQWCGNRECEWGFRD